MGRIIRRTFTITTNECWTIIWTDNDLPATSGELKISFSAQTEQANVPQETEVSAQLIAARPGAAAETAARDDNDDP